MTTIQPRSALNDLEPYVPGDADAGPEPVARLASNENALGASPTAQQAAQDAAAACHLYPDGSCRVLRGALSNALEVSSERLVCGNGSDDLIALLCNAYLSPGDAGVVTEHGFLMYRLCIQAQGGQVVTAPEPERSLDPDAILAHCGPGTRLVFVANPNNPTGAHLSGAQLERLHAGLPSSALLVLDTAYAEYATAEDYDRGLALAARADNVAVLGTFSKIYGLAALRLGWIYAPGHVCDVLNRLRSPFSVNGVAQAAGVAALQDGDHIAHSRAHNQRWRDWTAKELRARGFGVYPSQGNFLLMRCPPECGSSPASLRDGLKARGVLVRPVDKYGLDDCLRISIGTGEAMQALIARLDELLAA